MRSGGQPPLYPLWEGAKGKASGEGRAATKRAVPGTGTGPATAGRSEDVPLEKLDGPARLAADFPRGLEGISQDRRLTAQGRADQ